MRNMTISQVAEQADLSPSFVSMVERGKADISLARLARFAALYEVKLSQLLLDELHGKPQLVRPQDGLQIDRGSGVTYRLLPVQLFGVQVMHVLFDPHAGFKDMLSHAGTDFVWVVRGAIEVLYGDEAYVVASGQALSYPAGIPHAFKNATTEPAEVITFVTPPFW